MSLGSRSGVHRRCDRPIGRSGDAPLRFVMKKVPCLSNCAAHSNVALNHSGVLSLAAAGAAARRGTR